MRYQFALVSVGCLECGMDHWFVDSYEFLKDAQIEANKRNKESSSDRECVVFDLTEPSFDRTY